ncbi:MAG: hypothetical protein ACLP5H_17565 [Desulfomonilaceae bacterium]
MGICVKMATALPLSGLLGPALGTLPNHRSHPFTWQRPEDNKNGKFAA